MASSSSAAESLLTTCMANVITKDLAYGACLMNSGFFEVVARTQSSRDDLTRLAASLAANSSMASAAFVTSLVASNRAGNVVFGQCQLRCSAPTTLGASASCCRAVANVKNCKTSNAALAQCSRIFDDTLALHGQCALSASNVGLIVAAAVIVVLVVALIVVTRRFTKRRAQGDDLESRLAAGALNRWHAMLAAWQQVTNLVWKNWVLRRRRPVALVMEQLLPVLLVTGLVFIANLETIFPSVSTRRRESLSTEAYIPKTNEVVICSGLESMEEVDIGTPNDTQKTFYSSGQTVLGMFLLISYIKFVSTTTTTMVIEKETRIREVMKIMGLSDLTLLLSWIVTSALLSTPLAFGIAAELKFGSVFPVAEYSTLVFLFWSFSLSIVAFSYFITPFFDKSRTASIASVLMWIILYFPFFSVQSKVNSTKYTAALSPPTAFALAVDDLLRRAQLGKGFAYSLAVLENPITVPSAFSMSWMLMLDSCLLFLLGWYLEQVLPQQYGVRKPWNFCFKRSFWFPSAVSETPNHLVETPPSTRSPRGDFNRVQDESEMDGVLSSDGSVIFLKQQSSLPNDIVEPVSSALATQEAKGTCLQIRRLRKVFQVDDGEKIAVHQLDLTFYSGQITALLGHNGAGKTTTISMLTGLIAPTSGDATLYGRSIRNDFNELRQIMGICPQHDVLFNDMTVEEHLRLFGTMKRVPPHKLQAEVDKMIQEVGLTEKRRVLSKNLSGGQKRKLSVAIAFIGDSKLVFLDEPTSGMDPYSRRFTWNLLQRNREDRVIVLTTHFMDEADILGDRIAIMADGQLCCAGSSLFLKNRYGAGYNLTLIKSPGCDVEAVSRFLRKYVSDSKCLSSYGSEIVFQLPSHASSLFPPLLESLDANMRSLGIQQYGISVTTLEEVFLRIARDRDEGSLAVAGINPVDQVRKTSATSSQTRPTNRIASVSTLDPSFFTQYAAMLKKRIRITKRDRKSLMNAICIPLLFLIILLVLPEINVANFLPDYTVSLATPAMQANCTAANFTKVEFTVNDELRCNTKSFDYCSLGVIDCDAKACCTQRNIESPYYPCNTCTAKSRTPCYNSQCLARDGAKLQVTLNAFLVAVVVMLAFAFIPAATVAFIVREKNPIQNAKSLQLICGANVSAYWFANWTHDSLVMMLTVVAAAIIVPLSSRALGGASEAAGVAALVGSHALAVIPLAYLFSFRFNKHAVAQTSLLVFALSTGGLLKHFFVLVPNH
ncbi:hypothetical protein PINS_up005344 [Pythium insidiosum]|nr:hypothetical protein PINS_up005344 [Pythium insidiosum]